MLVFGDLKTFAICYRPYEKLGLDIALAHCHLVLAGHIIGERAEPCLLNTWTASVEDFRQHISSHRVSLANPLFNGLTDEEILAIILKSNQFEDEFDPAFSCLPHQPSNDLWVRHYVSLDETTDAFIIVVIEQNESLKFIWKGWREPCPSQDIGKLHAVSVRYEDFDSVVSSCLEFLQGKYPDFQPPK
jgi:hypothetical protein